MGAFFVSAEFVRLEKVEDAELEALQYLVRHVGGKQAGSFQNIMQMRLRYARKACGATLGQFAAANSRPEVRDEPAL